MDRINQIVQAIAYLFSLLFGRKAKEVEDVAKPDPEKPANPDDVVRRLQ